MGTQKLLHNMGKNNKKLGEDFESEEAASRDSRGNGLVPHNNSYGSYGIGNRGAKLKTIEYAAKPTKTGHPVYRLTKILTPISRSSNR